MMGFMARPVRYASEAGREATERNQNIDGLAAAARTTAIERIKSNKLGELVEDPLGALIDEARSSA